MKSRLEELSDMIEESSAMQPSDNPETLSAPTQFATGDSAAGEDLRRQILLQLTDGRLDRKHLSVAVCGGTAVLRGRVRTSHEKDLCLACARQVPGVTHVVDDLSVAE